METFEGHNNAHVGGNAGNNNGNNNGNNAGNELNHEVLSSKHVIEHFQRWYVSIFH